MTVKLNNDNGLHTRTTERQHTTGVWRQWRVTWLIEHSARINLPQARGVFEALARKRAEGGVLGRPKGRKSSKTKLTGQELKIKELLDKKVSYSAIARILGVHRLTVSKFAKERLVQNNL